MESGLWAPRSVKNSIDAVFSLPSSLVWWDRQNSLVSALIIFGKHKPSPGAGGVLSHPVYIGEEDRNYTEVVSAPARMFFIEVKSCHGLIYTTIIGQRCTFLHAETTKDIGQELTTYTKMAHILPTPCSSILSFRAKGWVVRHLSHACRLWLCFVLL